MNESAPRSGLGSLALPPLHGNDLGPRAAPKLRTPAGKIVPIPGGKAALDDPRPLTASYAGKP
ncbi:hypothetical protein [Amycolatopsis sp. lyj-112]|uniref:hypothetical protein n=1 Tax=Amycolatopsis sp. lyj-112 TaxID=2789288 RepID=UPI00397C4D43